MSIRSFCLGSGSAGNSFYVDNNADFRLLVDIGFSFKRTQELLNERGCDIYNINVVFITHEHSDHCQGLKVFLKKVKRAVVYISCGTFDALKKNDEFFLENKDRFIFVKEYDVLNLDDLRVLVVGKSHDSREALSFVFENSSKKIGVFTDLGFVSAQIRNILRSLDVVYLEANYCEKIISTKKDLNYNYVNRLTSDIGHLSLKDCVFELAGLFEEGCKVVLSHISRNTNTYENVYRHALDVFEKVSGKGSFKISFQDECGDWD